MKLCGWFECAENGERAMQLVQTSPRRPDVIIIDQNMEPGGGLMLGHQVVELLRKDKAFDNVVIIGCTGMAEEARQDLLLAGCDAVWSKPMPSREEAQAQIVQILKNKKSAMNSDLLDYDLSSYPGFTSQQIYERNFGPGYSSALQDEQKTSDLDIPVFRQVKNGQNFVQTDPIHCFLASILPELGLVEEQNLPHQVLILVFFLLRRNLSLLVLVLVQLLLVIKMMTSQIRIH